MSLSPLASSAPTLKVHALNSQNRAGVAQLVFDTHMKSVTPLFYFLKLRPLALILWTAISTGILRFRHTSLNNYLEILTVLAGSVIIAQAILFLTLLYEASTTAPGHLGVGQLEVFGDLDQQELGSSSSVASASGGSKKRSPADSTAAPTTSLDKNMDEVKGGSLAGKDNKFFVLEKTSRVVGCIGAVVDRSKSQATLTNWAVNAEDQRRGAGTLLLKTIMDSLVEDNKKNKVDVVKVKLQGYQIPALRLFHKFGFVQIDRTPEWMGERVLLELKLKDWKANLAKVQAQK